MRRVDLRWIGHRTDSVPTAEMPAELLAGEMVAVIPVAEANFLTWFLESYRASDAHEAINQHDGLMAIARQCAQFLLQHSSLHSDEWREQVRRTFDMERPGWRDEFAATDSGPPCPVCCGPRHSDGSTPKPQCNRCHVDEAGALVQCAEHEEPL